MAIALVAGAHAIAGGLSGGTTAAINTTGANLIVLAVGSNANAVTISDSNSNTYTALTPQSDTASGTTVTSLLYYCSSPVVGAGHTFTIAGTLTSGTLAVAAFSGAASSSPFDVQNGAAGVTTNLGSIQTGSILPSQANELVVSGIAAGVGAATTFSVDSGLTITDQISTGSDTPVALAYIIQTAASSINPTWSSSPSRLAAVIASFKAGAAVDVLMAQAVL